MGSHWPLVVAASIIALAAGLGIYQHDRAAEAATTVVEATVPAATQPGSRTPAKANAAPTAGPAAKPLPSAVVAKPAVSPVASAAATVAPPAVNQVPVTPGPTAPAAAPKLDLGTGRPFKPAADAPAAPIAPAVVAPEMPKPAKRDPNAQVLQDLRTAFQEKLNVVPRDLGVAGAFAVAMKGVRVEVQPWPQWSVSIYNFNDVAAEQETESFKASLEIVAKALNIDLTQGAVKTETGKSYMKTTSSLGSISLVRDPATNNSCMIRPIQAQVPMGFPPRPRAGPETAPRPPKQPAPPVQPPRPSAKDEIF